MKKYIKWGLIIVVGIIVLHIAYAAYLGAYAQGSAS